MNRAKLLAGGLLGVLLLAGCAGVPTVDTTIAAFYAPEYRTAGTIAVVAATVEQNDSLEFRHYKVRIEQYLSANGYKVRRDPFDAEYIALVACGIDEGKTGAVTTPMFGLGGGGGIFTSFGTQPYLMPAYGTAAAAMDSASGYTRAVAMDIVKTDEFKDGRPKKLFELRAKSVGASIDIACVFEEMLEAMFKDFPGESGKARKISVSFKGGC